MKFYMLYERLTKLFFSVLHKLMCDRIMSIKHYYLVILFFAIQVTVTYSLSEDVATNLNVEQQKKSTLSETVTFKRNLQVACYSDSECKEGIEVCFHDHDRLAERRIGELSEKISNIRKPRKGFESLNPVGVCVLKNSGILTGEGLFGGRINTGIPGRIITNNIIGGRQGTINSVNRFGGNFQPYGSYIANPYLENSSNKFTAPFSKRVYLYDQAVSSNPNVSNGNTNTLKSSPDQQLDNSYVSQHGSHSGIVETAGASPLLSSRKPVESYKLLPSTSSVGEQQKFSYQHSSSSMGIPQINTTPSQYDVSSGGVTSQFNFPQNVAQNTFPNNFSILAFPDGNFNNKNEAGEYNSFPHSYEEMNTLNKRLESIANSFLKSNGAGGLLGYFPNGVNKNNIFGGMYPLSSQFLASISSQIIRQLVYRTIKPRIVCLPTEIYPQFGNYAFIRYPQNRVVDNESKSEFLDSLSSHLQDHSGFLNLEYNHLFYILDPRFPMYDLMKESSPIPTSKNIAGVFGQQGDESQENSSNQNVNRNQRTLTEESGAYTLFEYLQKTDVLNLMFSQLSGMYHDDDPSNQENYNLNAGGDLISKNGGATENNNSKNQDFVSKASKNNDSVVDAEEDSEFLNIVQLFLLQKSSKSLQGQQTAIMDVELPVVYVRPILSNEALHIQPGVIAYQCTDTSTKYLWFKVNVFDGKHTVKQKCSAKIVCRSPYSKFTNMSKNVDNSNETLLREPFGMSLNNKKEKTWKKHCPPSDPHCGIDDEIIYDDFSNSVEKKPAESQNVSKKFSLYVQSFKEPHERNNSTFVNTSFSSINPINNSNSGDEVYPQLECLLPEVLISASKLSSMLPHGRKNDILKFRKIEDKNNDNNLYIFRAYATKTSLKPKLNYFIEDLKQMSDTFDQHFDLYNYQVTKKNEWIPIKMDQLHFPCIKNENHRFVELFGISVKSKTNNSTAFELVCPAFIDCIEDDNSLYNNAVECLDYSIYAYVNQSASILVKASSIVYYNDEGKDRIENLHEIKSIVKFKENFLPPNLISLKVQLLQSSDFDKNVNHSTTKLKVIASNPYEYSYEYKCGENVTKEKLTFGIVAINRNDEVATRSCDVFIECLMPSKPVIECKKPVKNNIQSSSSSFSMVTLNIKNMLENELFVINFPSNSSMIEKSRINVEVRDLDSNYIFEEKVSIYCNEKGRKKVRILVIIKDDEFSEETQNICEAIIVCE